MMSDSKLSVLLEYVKNVVLAGIFLFIACSESQDTHHSSVDSTDTSDTETVQFVDVAAEVGVTFKHTNAATGRYWYLESYGSGAAFFDYDNDGDLDIYLLNGAPLPGYDPQEKLTNVLYRNNGDGTFTDVTEIAGVGDTGYGMGCAIADYDNDGDQDLYVTNFRANVFYRNNGDGTFTDITQEAGVGDTLWSTSCTFVDYDNDGFLDLYVDSYVDYSFAKDKKCTHRGIRSYCDPDEYPGIPDVLYHNDGDGTFTNVTKSAGVYNPLGKGLGVVCGDYDNDGDQDIYVANDGVQNFLYQNNGDGTFTDVSLFSGVGFNENGKAEAGMGTDFGDYNNDGLLDIIVFNFSLETCTLYRNNGGTPATFSDVTISAGLAAPTFKTLGFGTNFFDYDNDGDQDIFVANGHVVDNISLIDPTLTHAEKAQLFRNNGCKEGQPTTFTEVSQQSGEYFSIPKVGRGVAFGDYDNDGDIDLLINNENQQAALLRNDGGNRNNFLMIKTIGTTSNRDGIGARVYVTTGKLTQMDEVRSGSSYCSSHDRRLHFGLGKYPKADLVKIRWPSGLVEEFQDVQANQILVLREGEGIVEYIALASTK